MLICSLRERAQVEQLLRFIVEESPEDADSKRAFKYVHYGLLEIISLAFADKLYPDVLLTWFYDISKDYLEPRLINLKACFSIRFPFISSEVLTCEIDVILKTLVEDEEVLY